MTYGDKYRCFAELALNESRIHYDIEFNDRKSKVLVLTIHGGGIETGTSELALAITNSDYRYYLFEGRKVKGNKDLHITSVHFDEENCLRLVGNSEVTLSIHGKNGNGDCTYLGGLDHTLKQEISKALIRNGFPAVILPEDNRLAGVQPRNITNKNKRGMGVQLEIEAGLTYKMFKVNSRSMRKKTQTRIFERYVKIIREVLEKRS